MDEEFEGPEGYAVNWLQDRRSWTCGCDYNKTEQARCTRHQKMMETIYNEVYVGGKYLEETWNLQDGYGEPGFNPIQGWDWSGIRDSTPFAIESMYWKIRELQKQEVATLGGPQVENPGV